MRQNAKKTKIVLMSKTCKIHCNTTVKKHYIKTSNTA